MNLLSVSAELWKDFILNVFPAICINCNDTLVRDEQYICSSCKISLPKTKDYNIPTNRLFQKFAYESKIKHVSSFLDYNRQGITRKLIHKLKYKGETDLGILLGRMYAEDLNKHTLLKPDYILPVPLHPKKLKRRGYNQSELIAQGLSDILNVPMDPNLLHRMKYTSTQTKKSKVNRWENVGEVFAIPEPKKLKNKKVMLVDDVLTTGATLGSLSSQIAKCEVAEIYLIAIAAGA